MHLPWPFGCCLAMNKVALVLAWKHGLKKTMYDLYLIYFDVELHVREQC